MKPGSPISIEGALLDAFPFLLGGLVVAIPLLFVSLGTEPLLGFTLHLAAVVALAIAVAIRLAPAADGEWFGDMRWTRQRRLFSSAVVVIVMVTGLAALVTLATSAALRYQPSLQFLQLLSVLDIAWAGAAIVVGSRRLWGRRAGLAGGIALGVFCVWSIWNYLRIVGFTSDGGWLVRGEEIMRLVLPFDMAAALVAVTLLVLGTRKRAAEQPVAQPIEQASSQS